MTTGVDFARLTAALLEGQAREAEIKVCLALAHHDGSPISDRRLAELAHISYSTAQVGIRLARANGRITRTELRSVEEAKNASLPRWQYAVADTYLHLDSVQGLITGSTVQTPPKSFIRPAPEFGAAPSSTGLPAPGFGAGSDAETTGTPVASSCSTSPEEFIKPIGEDPPLVPPLAAVAPPSNGHKPETKRERDRRESKARREAREEASRERKRLKAAEVEERKALAAAERARKADAAALKAADPIDLDRAPVEVQIVYRKIREVLGCKTAAPSKAQASDAVIFAREILGRPASAEQCCVELDDWKEDWHADRLGHRRSHKPYMGDLRNTFETSLALRAGTPELGSPRAGGNVVEMTPAKRAVQEFRKAVAEKRREYLEAKNAIDG